MWEKKGIIECDKSTVTCNVGTTQYDDGIVKFEKKKKKETTKCDNSIVKCEVGTAQCDDRTVKCEKKRRRKSPNVTKELSHVMLELHNVIMKPSNVRNK